MANTLLGNLVGKTIYSITGAEKGSMEVDFHVVGFGTYRMYHRQDCCEHVSIDQIDGDINDLLNSPITLAEESTNRDNPPKNADSFTWTFYRFATVNGYVTFKWLGESNGYYSEGVDFELL